jgi:hypothetical protein
MTEPLSEHSKSEMRRLEAQSPARTAISCPDKNYITRSFVEACKTKDYRHGCQKYQDFMNTLTKEK